LGLGVVAVLLERDDDEELWTEVMGSDVIMAPVAPDDIEL
jgi:hypothetical protein